MRTQHVEVRRREMSLQVTKALIEQATAKESRTCMIAQAVRTAIPSARNVMVDLATIRFTDAKNRSRYIYLTPHTVQQNLVDFDQGKPVEPFRVRLRLAQVAPATATKNGKTKRKYGRKRVNKDGVIQGGKPLPSAHLNSRNITLKHGGQFKRAYGLRQLQP
jgi:hypothetical protein